MKVFLDAGHGGKDPGAVGNGMQEKNITLPVTLEVGKILERHGITVGYSRKTDVYVSLEDRAEKANNFNSDIFVSIHCNAFEKPSAQGVETYSHIGSTKGAKLAKSIHDEVIKAKLYTRNRGTKTANFYVLRKTIAPAALIELAFITNKDDANLLKTKQKELALAIAKGILSYLGITYKGGNNMTLDKNTPSPWAKEAWEWAKKDGICDGTRPKDAATREEVVTMLYRFSKKVK